METLLYIVHVLVCIGMLPVILLQSGKGGGVSAVFGGGSSGTVFGSRGASNFLTRMTAGCAVVFMLTSFGPIVARLAATIGRRRHPRAARADRAGGAGVRRPARTGAAPGRKRGGTGGDAIAYRANAGRGLGGRGCAGRRISRDRRAGQTVAILKGGDVEPKVSCLTRLQRATMSVRPRNAAVVKLVDTPS